MNVQEQIKKYITSQPEPKRSDMRELHRPTLEVSPDGSIERAQSTSPGLHAFVKTPPIEY